MRHLPVPLESPHGRQRSEICGAARAHPRQHLPGGTDGRGQDLGGQAARQAPRQDLLRLRPGDRARDRGQDPGDLRDRGRGRLPRARGADAGGARPARRTSCSPPAAARCCPPTTASCSPGTARWSTCARRSRTCGSARVTTGTARCCKTAEPLRQARAAVTPSAIRSTARSPTSSSTPATRAWAASPTGWSNC